MRSTCLHRCILWIPRWLNGHLNSFPRLVNNLVKKYLQKWYCAVSEVKAETLFVLKKNTKLVDTSLLLKGQRKELHFGWWEIFGPCFWTTCAQSIYRRAVFKIWGISSRAVAIRQRSWRRFFFAYMLPIRDLCATAFCVLLSFVFLRKIIINNAALHFMPRMNAVFALDVATALRQINR